MPIITFSRGTYSGAKAVADRVAEELCIPILSREQLVEESGSADLSNEVLAVAEEKAPPLFERLARRRESYLAAIRSVLCQRAVEGSFVYHGNDGHLLLTDLPNVLRVRVVAPMSYRISAAMTRLGIDEREAVTLIHKVNKQRERWTQFLYGMAWGEPSHYDLVVNLEILQVDEVCEVVCRLAERDRFQWNAEKRRRVADLALASRVLAELTKENDTRAAEVAVNADSGLVTISGKTRLPGVRDAIIAAAENTPGVREIRSEITVPADVLSG